MDKLLKYCLSFIMFMIVFSCHKETTLSAAEKRLLAEETYSKAVQFTQGSTEFQNGIVDALAIDPNYPQGVYELSVAHLKRGMPNKWLQQYDKAVKLDSITRIPWRGYLYLWFYRDYKKAIKDFDTSDTLTPNFIDQPQGISVDYWRGVAYLGLKDYEQSISFFDKYMNKQIEELGEDWIEIKAFLFIGIAYFESNNLEKANMYFDKVIKCNEGNYADAKYYKALIYKQTGEVLLAKKLIESALEDFNNGYINRRPYVESLRQLYLADYNELKESLK